LRQWPNLLSLTRLFLSPIVAGFLYFDLYRGAFFLFVFACATDALDGLAARVMQSKTLLGRYLDPIADKILLVTLFVSIGFLGHLPSLIPIVVVTRDMLILGGALYMYSKNLGLNIQPLFIGKLTTFLQMALLATLLADKAFYPVRGLSELIRILSIGVFVTTVLSGLSYVVISFIHYHKSRSLERRS